jgi:hypothetical protein
MKVLHLVALFCLGVLGPVAPVSAKSGDVAETVARVRAWIAEATAVETIADTLGSDGVETADVLLMLTDFANTAEPPEVLYALIAHGLTAEEAAAIVVALHKDETPEEKVRRLEQLGLEFFEYVRLLVGLHSSASTAERMDYLMGAGLTLEQSIDFLVYFTLAPRKQEELLDVLTGAGLTLAAAANLLLEAEAPAQFAVPLQNLAPLPFGPGNFSSNPLSGTAGGGVSTSQ